MKRTSQNLTSYEQETIINFNEEEKTAAVYTYNKATIKMLDKCCLDYPDMFVLLKADVYGKHISKSYVIPKKYVKIRKPKILSDVQRILAVEKAKKMREAQSLTS